MTAIIILNWNGSDDTIECLKSLYKINSEPFFIVCVDNGSTDGSAGFIKKWLKTAGIKIISLNENVESFPSIIENGTCILYSLVENYGFAKGNNFGVKLARFFSPDYYLLLNNDTVVYSNFLKILIDFIEKHSNFKALTPLIKYYNEPEKIWNCGGQLFFGFRKYFYANDLIVNIKEREFINITFVTGCALFFNSELVEKNDIFTEKFFFGEEDFDFSMRMKRDGVKIACVIDSQILHKVSSSTSQMNNIGKIYMYYLNRFVNVKNHFDPIKFFIWKCICFLYIFYILKKKEISFNDILLIIKRLTTESKNLNGISKELFFNTISKEI